MFHIKSKVDYQEEYQKSLRDTSLFWDDVARHFTWFKKWQKTQNCDLKQSKIEWFKCGKTQSCL